MTTIYLIIVILFTVSGVFNLAFYLNMRDKKSIYDEEFNRSIRSNVPYRIWMENLAEQAYKKALKRFFISATLFGCLLIILTLLILTSASWSKLN